MTHKPGAPDPALVIQKVFEILGGREAFDRATDESVKTFDAAWERDTDRIGRVLRAHLAIEHFLTKNIEAANPRLGSIEDARLTFAQKVELADRDDRIVSVLLPGIRRLNQVRNRIAHKLQVDITTQDRDVFLSVAIFKESRNQGCTQLGKGSSAPLDVLEDFAHFAAGLLHSATSATGAAFRQAFASVELLQQPIAEDSSGLCDVAADSETLPQAHDADHSRG
jgi:hypothetical protein